MIDLFDKMEKIFDRKSDYKKDYDLYERDFKDMLSGDENSNYYWIFRKHGTLLMKSRFINMKESDELFFVEYYLEQDRLLSVYQIEVDSIKKGKCFGSIKKVDMKKFKHFISHPVDPTYADKMDMLVASLDYSLWKDAPFESVKDHFLNKCKDLDMSSNDHYLLGKCKSKDELVDMAEKLKDNNNAEEFYMCRYA